MRKIGLMSDTHGYLDKQIAEVFKDCDEIWHAGDFGSVEFAESLMKIKPVRGVYGNIDGKDLRMMFPEVLSFDCEGLKVLMVHIGGYPGKFPPQVRRLIELHKPGLFICGHSHILKVMRDAEYGNMLCMNPGAAGIEGFHKIKTVLRFGVENGRVINLEAVELGKRGQL